MNSNFPKPPPIQPYRPPSRPMPPPPPRPTVINPTTGIPMQGNNRGGYDLGGTPYGQQPKRR